MAISTPYIDGPNDLYLYNNYGGTIKKFPFGTSYVVGNIVIVQAAINLNISLDGIQSGGIVITTENVDSPASLPEFNMFSYDPKSDAGIKDVRYTFQGLSLRCAPGSMSNFEIIIGMRRYTSNNTNYYTQINIFDTDSQQSLFQSYRNTPLTFYNNFSQNGAATCIGTYEFDAQ